MQSMRRGAIAATIVSVCLVLMAQVGASAQAATGDTELVSVTADGKSAAGDSNLRHGGAALSADGRYVAFYSYRSNLVRGDENRLPDVFLRDRQASVTTLVSASANGRTGNGWSGMPSISRDGRYVCFMSAASNLVAGDDNGAADIFVWDRDTGRTELASVTTGGAPGDDSSLEAGLSADGRYVAFTSLATNLSSRDTRGLTQIFLRDRQAGATHLVSVSSQGVVADDYSWQPTVSADGRYVAFYSNASNLVPNDREGWSDVFVRDRQSGQTHRVSVDSNGRPGNAASVQPTISANGRFVVFVSVASNLVPGDTNQRVDVFVHDLQTHQTERVSVASDGRQGDGGSYEPSISSDGRYVTFESFSTNLVDDDTNGTYDVFVHDRQTRRTRRVSLGTGRQQADEASWTPSISEDGRFVAFRSDATNLSHMDANTSSDVYVHEFGVEAFTIKPTSLDLGAQPVGTRSTAAFWLRNKGSSPLAIESFEVRGTDHESFSFTHACGNVVAPGDVCGIRVTFKPGSAGAKSATLKVVAGGGAIRTRDLLGRGT
jgi:Tol biopolymer transport system component